VARIAGLRACSARRGGLPLRLQPAAALGAGERLGRIDDQPVCPPSALKTRPGLFLEMKRALRSNSREKPELVTGRA